jgi:hypothetical protein
MAKVKLLFVHVPKAGGTSITKALERRFGRNLLHDNDAPGNPISPMNMDPDGFLRRFHGGSYEVLDQKEAVAGHFWIRKYEPVKAEIRATIVRHPIDRAISNYFFWLAPVFVGDHPLREHVINMKLDFMQFARLPIMRWFYSRYLFRDVDMGVFDYIGNYSSLSANWASTMRRLGLDSPELHHNETRAHSPDYPIQYSEIVNDRVKMAELREIFIDDIKFYERCVARS